MCEGKKVENLPLLPGLTFQDPAKNRFHISHSLDVKQGFALQKNFFRGCGGDPRDIDSLKLVNTSFDGNYYDPSITYGRVKEDAYPQFRPHYVLYDKKCLTFRAFFKQAVFESPMEHFRVRPVNIIYFLEDDTISVMEPTVDNAGFPQGKLIRRGKIIKNTNGDIWHWKDLNVAIDVELNGIVFHTVDCDNFTKEYMASQGIEINDSEQMPIDPYIQHRQMKLIKQPQNRPCVDDTFRKYLEFGGKILRFRAVWDDRESEHGELRSFCLCYYLEDDTVSVNIIHTNNDGRDPCTALLSRMKLPKNYEDVPVDFPSILMEKSDAEVTEYYQPKDFIIGQTIFVLGRRMLLHRTDQETRNYYCKALNIKQPDNFEVEEKPKPLPVEPPPPHVSGIGSLDDSLQSFLRIYITPPKRDEIRLIINANKFLRYTAKMVTTHPEDKDRKFLMQYSLADSKVRILEPPVRNSGIRPGKFLSDILLPKPSCHPDYPLYYGPDDFYIGAHVKVFGKVFEITDCDLAVYRYMEANPEKFRSEVVDNVRNHMVKCGYLRDDVDTVTQSVLNPVDYPAQKVCTRLEEKDELPKICEVNAPCQMDPDYRPKTELPEECFECPYPLPCGQVPSECKQTKEPEVTYNDLSGQIIFNRQNPDWKF